MNAPIQTLAAVAERLDAKQVFVPLFGLVV
jgi:hypothetical protein